MLIAVGQIFVMLRPGAGDGHRARTAQASIHEHAQDCGVAAIGDESESGPFADGPVLYRAVRRAGVGGVGEMAGEPGRPADSFCLAVRGSDELAEYM
jgi:hypothetical protein